MGVDGMTADPVRVVFAGAGMVAECHQRALARERHLLLTGIVEPESGLASRRAAEWGCRVFGDYREALAEPEVEAIFVLTPDAVHEEVALAALAAGKHVLVEKPVATADGIARMREAAERSGLVCMPGHNYAYQPEFSQLRQRVADDSLGRVRAAWITYAIKHPEEVAEHYGGVLDEVMIHHVYLCLAMLGVPERVYAARMQPAWRSLQTEDQAWMTWHFSGGASAHLFASFAVSDETDDPWMFVVKVLGSRGGATYNWGAPGLEGPLGSLSFAIPAYEDSYVHEQRAFASAVRGDSSAVASTLADAEVAALLLEAAGEADRTGCGVQINDLGGMARG